MVCQECLRLRREGYHRAHPNRTGLITKGIHRVVCFECVPNIVTWEKIIDKTIILDRDK